MGFVYLFRHTGIKGVKIGMTNNNKGVLARFDSFKTYAPNGAEIIGIIETDNPQAEEKRLHRKFKDKRMSGEFFDLTDTEIRRLLKDNSETELLAIFRGVSNSLKIEIVDYAKEIESGFFKVKKYSELGYPTDVINILSVITSFMRRQNVNRMTSSMDELMDLFPYTRLDLKRSLNKAGIKSNGPEYYKFNGIGVTKRRYSIDLSVLEKIIR